MIKLSEIIRTDCYIDCGSNEKLREVVGVLPYTIHNYFKRVDFSDISEDTVIVSNLGYLYSKLPLSEIDELELDLPIHHISQIELNA